MVIMEDAYLFYDCKVVQGIVELAEYIGIGIELEGRAFIEGICTFEHHFNGACGFVFIYGGQEAEAACVYAQYGYFGFTDVRYTFQQRAIAADADP